MEESRMASIPLLQFSSLISQEVEFLRNGKQTGTDLARIKIALDSQFPPQCYGVRVEDQTMSPLLQPGGVGVFSMREGHKSALMAVCSVGIQGEPPRIRKVLKNESGQGTGGSQKTGARKSFMTPTPLHIPGSRISPIADSTHQMIYLEAFAGSGEVTLVPAEKLLWMHPLVRILKPQEYRI